MKTNVKYLVKENKKDNTLNISTVIPLKELTYMFNLQMSTVHADDGDHTECNERITANDVYSNIYTNKDVRQKLYSRRDAPKGLGSSIVDWDDTKLLKKDLKCTVTLTVFRNDEEGRIIIFDDITKLESFYSLVETFRFKHNLNIDTDFAIDDEVYKYYYRKFIKVFSERDSSKLKTLQPLTKQRNSYLLSVIEAVNNRIGCYLDKYMEISYSNLYILDVIEDILDIRRMVVNVTLDTPELVIALETGYERVTILEKYIISRVHSIYSKFFKEDDVMLIMVDFLEILNNNLNTELNINVVDDAITFTTQLMADEKGKGGTRFLDDILYSLCRVRF